MSWLRDAREFLAFAKDLRDFLVTMGRCLRDEKEDRARALLDMRIREQASGRAAHQASRMAGPRNNYGRTVDE